MTRSRRPARHRLTPRFVALPFVALIALLGLACGRSALPAVQCRFSEASSCDELAAEGARMQGLYDDALATLVSDAPEAVADARTTLDGAGFCMRQVVRAQLDRCEVDRCGALCAFEPCAIRAEDGGAAPASECATRCEDLAGTVSQPALDDAIVRAAGNPGVCNCLACDAASAPLCDGLFRCEAAVTE